MRDDALWDRLSGLSLDQPGAALPFTARLARDNGWPPRFAEAVTAEYLRFAYLAQVADFPVTPSDEVDQAWHLHLLYTRHYWGPFTQALGAPLHHGPTEGGGTEGARFSGQYARTLALYEAEFGVPPPRAIWPDASVRFTKPLTARRVLLSDVALVPRRILPGPRARRALAAAAACVLAAPVMVAAHDGLASAGEHEDGFLVGFAVHAVREHLGATIAYVLVTALFAWLIGAVIFGAKGRGKDGGTGCGSSGDGGGSGCSGCGGCGGCGG